MGFSDDLELGKKFELVFFENELTDENEIYQSEGLCKGWDLKTMDGRMFEVKACRRWRSTGNILVEFGCNGHTSGITTTTSETWAFYQLGEDDMWIKVVQVPTTTLKKMIADKCYSHVIFGAARKMSDYYLFKESLLFSNKYKENVKVSVNQDYQRMLRA